MPPRSSNIEQAFADNVEAREERRVVISHCSFPRLDRPTQDGEQAQSRLAKSDKSNSLAVIRMRRESTRAA